MFYIVDDSDELDREETSMLNSDLSVETNSDNDELSFMTPYNYDLDVMSDEYEISSEEDDIDSNEESSTDSNKESSTDSNKDDSDSNVTPHDKQDNFEYLNDDNMDADLYQNQDDNYEESNMLNDENEILDNFLTTSEEPVLEPEDFVGYNLERWEYENLILFYS